MIKKGTHVTVAHYCPFYGLSGIVTTVKNCGCIRNAYIKVDGHINPTNKNYDVVLPLYYLKEYSSVVAKRARIHTSAITDDKKAKLLDRLLYNFDFDVDSSLPKKY